MRKTMIAAACFALFSASSSIAQDRSEITLGNGEKNWIIVDDVMRETLNIYTEKRVAGQASAVRRGDGVTLIFSEVHIEGDGWLVMHPFINGAPNGDYVAGYTYIESGTNKDVSITLNPVPASGDMYIVMMHRDVNEDRVFDFIFVGDGINVEDRAVFEGTKMIAHAIAVP